MVNLSNCPFKLRNAPLSALVLCIWRFGGAPGLAAGLSELLEPALVVPASRERQVLGVPFLNILNHGKKYSIIFQYQGGRPRWADTPCLPSEPGASEATMRFSRVHCIV